jgi:uncharacterized protein (TIGR03492 family)
VSALTDILLVSNGYGEFAIAGYIARAIADVDPQARLEHFPLVGTAPEGSWPKAVGPQADMPSGGLVANGNLRNFFRDVRGGLLGLVVRQRRFLRAQSARSALVAVGDIFCLSMSLLARRPTIFVATAKSDYVSPHSALEQRIAARADLVFVRDEHTARSLASKGVNARYAGNIMMDGIAPGRADLKPDEGAIRLAVLPGSRLDTPRVAAQSLERLDAIAELAAAAGRRVQAFVSLAPSVDALAVAHALRSRGLELSNLAPGEGVVAASRRGPLEVILVRGAFGDLLAASQLVLGQAGTANEQAAGAGKPVVAALAPGEQPRKMQWYRMRQKRLLGDALLVLPHDPKVYAREVLALVDDAPRRSAMSAAGRARMGNPGGARAVAAATLSLAESAA